MLGQIQLPRDTEAIIHPAESLAESIVSKGHQGFAVVDELSVKGFQLVVVFALNIDRHRWSKGESMFNVAINRHELLAVQAKDCVNDAALGAWALRSVTRN